MTDVSGDVPPAEGGGLPTDDDDAVTEEDFFEALLFAAIQFFITLLWPLVIDSALGRNQIPPEGS